MDIEAVIVPTHIAAAVAAVPIGAVQFMRRKGGRFHRILGWIWVGLMAFVALGSFWIQELIPGSFSPVHLLAILTLSGLIAGMLAARRGNIARHRKAMIGLYVGLSVAGLASMAPGRFIASSLFGG